MGGEPRGEARSPFLATCGRVWVLLASVADVAIGGVHAESRDGMGLPGIGVRLKDETSPFKIAVFADLHYGENAWDAWGRRQDVDSTAVQSFLLDHETPDFVVYLGDVITANNLPRHDATLHWRQAVAPAVDRQIPFASVFGNHDDAAFVWDPCSGVGPGAPLQTTSREELMEFDGNLPSSFSLAGPKKLWPSVSNFAVPVDSPDGTRTVAIMYFLDSGGGSMPEFLSAEQAAWFAATASEVNPGASIPELVFWHIPSMAYTQAGPEASQPIEAPCVGSINEESIASQATEWGIMSVLASRNAVKEVRAGRLCRTQPWTGLVLSLERAAPVFRTAHRLWWLRYVETRSTVCGGFAGTHVADQNFCHSRGWKCGLRSATYVTVLDLCTTGKLIRY